MKSIRTWQIAFASLFLASALVMHSMHDTIKALRWDKAELQLTVTELYAEQEWAESCCNARGEGCGVPIYGTDC